MERALPSLKWKTTASAACIPRRDSTSPYSTAATVFPTASRIVCSLCSGLGGPIILGCSPLLACWLSIRAPSASCGRHLPSDTTHLTLAWLCPPSWDRQAPSSTVQATLALPKRESQMRSSRGPMGLRPFFFRSLFTEVRGRSILGSSPRKFQTSLIWGLRLVVMLARVG